MIEKEIEQKLKELKLVEEIPVGMDAFNIKEMLKSIWQNRWARICEVRRNAKLTREAAAFWKDHYTPTSRLGGTSD